MRKKTTDFEKVMVENDRYQVYLAYIGEGYNGDYNPDDENDEPLMRADVYDKNGNDEYNSSEPVASICTGYSIREKREAIIEYAKKILAAITRNTDKSIEYVIESVIL